ncbi:MAG: HPr family phosphocarrier protein, partial [Spirochaetales bacterium]|nr:HPr family phosphocarrier protein [Spirochaetales bacterium]
FSGLAGREKERMTYKDICLTASELKAIEEHKYYMSKKRGCEVKIEEAIEDFIQNYKSKWESEKQKQDNLEQIEEIKKHKYLRSELEGRDIGDTLAAEEWAQAYAHIWRAEKESLEKNGFLRMFLTVENEKGIHMRPSSAISKLTCQFDCDVYVNKKGMEHFNFILEGKKFINVKSVLGLLALAAVKGEELEFISTGSQAKEALEAISDMYYFKNPGPEDDNRQGSETFECA